MSIPDAKMIEALNRFDIVELVVIGMVVLAGIFLVKSLPKIIDARFKKLKDDNNQLETETNVLVKNINEAIKKLEENQIGLTNKVNILTENDKNNQMRTKDILKVVIYNDKLPILDRQEALINYFALGGNGATKEYALGEIILPHKDLWNSLEQKAYEKIPDYDPKKIYKATMLEIKKALNKAK